MTSFLSLHLSEQRKERLFYLTCPGVWVPSASRILFHTCSSTWLAICLTCSWILHASYPVCSCTSHSTCLLFPRASSFSYSTYSHTTRSSLFTCSRSSRALLTQLLPYTLRTFMTLAPRASCAPCINTNICYLAVP